MIGEDVIVHGDECNKLDDDSLTKILDTKLILHEKFSPYL